MTQTLLDFVCWLAKNTEIKMKKCRLYQKIEKEFENKIPDSRKDVTKTRFFHLKLLRLLAEHGCLTRKLGFIRRKLIKQPLARLSEKEHLHLLCIFNDYFHNKDTETVSADLLQ
jgi:hypothetical protein